jgi:hypothetical protein
MGVAGGGTSVCFLHMSTEVKYTERAFWCRRRKSYSILTCLQIEVTGLSTNISSRRMRGYFYVDV